MKERKWKRRKSGRRCGRNKKRRLLIMKDDLRNAKARPKWMDELLFTDHEQEEPDEDIAG